MALNIALLRCAQKPNFITWDIGDIENFFVDDRMLMKAFDEKGHHASQVIWSDPTIEWKNYDIVLIRSAWDYIDHCKEFLQVLQHIESAGCQLYNNYETVKWNADKNYLLDLMNWRAPVVPTYKASTPGLQDLFEKKKWEEAIIKPRIGGGASNIKRMPTNELQSTIDQLTIPDNFLVQPMISSIISEGEYAFIYIDGKLSYAHLKKPASGDFRVQGIYGGTLDVIHPSEQDAKQVQLIYNLIPFDPLYARIDVVRLQDTLVVMELELIEPILNFELSPHGVEQFVEGVLKKYNS